MSVDEQMRNDLSRRAWEARENARVLGNTRVGCAVVDDRNQLSVGCNIEHRFRSHDVHAEISALSAMVTSGGERLVAALIAADREKFTPCGACLDWIFELGGEDCSILIQRQPDGALQEYAAIELMPHYPH